MATVPKNRLVASCSYQRDRKIARPKLLIPEILKYQVKESDLVADRKWFLELTRQLHKIRAIAVGGILRQYMQKFRGEKPRPH